MSWPNGIYSLVQVWPKNNAFKMQELLSEGKVLQKENMGQLSNRKETRTVAYAFNPSTQEADPKQSIIYSYFLSYWEPWRPMAQKSMCVQTCIPH